MQLFHNFNVFGSCIVHILCTGCAKIKKKIRHQEVNVKITVCWIITPCVPVGNPEVKRNTVGVKYFNKHFNMNAA